tara:strand:+ start:437 stop:1108 length:672 start_codon:yes stop_codon:yes gene_type:complete
MSNSSDSQLNKIFDEKQKTLFKDCKQKYGLTINDIKPSGKTKTKPYTLKDIQSACSEKKKQTKKKPVTPLYPAQSSKSSSKTSSSKSKKNIDAKEKQVKGYKITLNLINPYKKKSEINPNDSEPYSDMDINEFKQWCEEKLALELGKSGATICNASYKVKNDSTLFMQFYVDDPKYDEADNTLDSILNINDILDRDQKDGYTEVTFGLNNKLIKPYHKKIKCI